MELRSKDTDPVTFAVDFTPPDSDVVSAAYTERMCRMLTGFKDDDELEQITDDDVKFALADGYEKAELSEDELQGVRVNLLEFAVYTASSVREQAQRRYEEHYYSATDIPNRIKLGRSALKLARQLAEQHTTIVNNVELRKVPRVLELESGRQVAALPSGEHSS